MPSCWKRLCSRIEMKESFIWKKDDAYFNSGVILMNLGLGRLGIACRENVAVWEIIYWILSLGIMQEAFLPVTRSAPVINGTLKPPLRLVTCYCFYNNNHTVLIYHNQEKNAI